MDDGIFQGLKVLDCASFIAAPAAATVLGDFGADVIKIEPPGSGDPYRNLPGGVGPFPFTYTPGAPRFTLPAQVFGPSLDFVWPVSYQTNVSIEREIGKRFSASASYVGAIRSNISPLHR